MSGGQFDGSNFLQGYGGGKGNADRRGIAGLGGGDGSGREFHSRLDNYTACACSFSTKTYSGSINGFFMEWGIAFSFVNNMDLLLNSRTELAKGDFVQALNFGAQWRF